MIEEMSEFGMSVLEIEGLTEYQPYALPPWLRVRLKDGTFDLSPNHDLVDRYVADCGDGEWLNEWGSALINRKPVFIVDSNTLVEPAVLSARLGCGMNIVDQGTRFFPDGYTVYFSDFRHRRRSTPPPKRLYCHERTDLS